jgi:hypothetical protein
VIGENVDAIRDSAFSDCPKLETATVGSRVRIIGYHVFMRCKALKTVIWKTNRIDAIHGGMFENCNDFTVKFGGTVSQWKSMMNFATKYWKDTTDANRFVMTVECSDGNTTM